MSARQKSAAFRRDDKCEAEQKVLSPADEKSGKSARHPSNIVISTEAKRSGEIAAFTDSRRHKCCDLSTTAAKSAASGRDDKCRRGKRVPPSVKMTNARRSKKSA